MTSVFIHDEDDSLRKELGEKCHVYDMARVREVPQRKITREKSDTCEKVAREKK